jgi:UTP--glucose-1-phosphate uridylyltransferase
MTSPRSRNRRTPREPTRTDPLCGVSRRRPRHALPARDQGEPEGNAAIVDKPLIQYAVEEALAAGARLLVFITGSSKRAIEDHFDSDPELEAALEAEGKKELLGTLRGILPADATCIYIRQPAPLGLGHAVLCAHAVVGDEPFFVHLADDLIDSEEPVLSQMRDRYLKSGGSVIGVQQVPHGQTGSYGIVATDDVSAEISRIRKMVEKPKPADAPSDLAVVGRYLLSGTIFERLKKVGRGAGGEIQLTDGIAALLNDEPVYAYRFKGKRYDCGSKLGYLEATVEYGLRHPELGNQFAKYLDDFVAGRKARA